MTEEKILSISIAGYNIEKSISRLIDSIIASGDISKLEIFIINDGSEDKTFEIAQMYEKMYPESVHAIDKENGGHGSTINKGMELATGKYFKPIDGDDWVEPEELHKIISYMETANTDLIISNFKRVYENSGCSEIVRADVPYDQLFRFDDCAVYLRKMCFHNIFFKTKILKEHRFRLEENCFYVDNEYDLYPLPFVRTVENKDYTVYCYRLGVKEQSVSAENLMKNEQQRKKVIANLLKWYREVENSLGVKKKVYINNFIKELIETQLNIYLAADISKENFKKALDFDNTIKSEYPDFYLNPVFPKIKIWRLHRKIFYPIVHIYCNFVRNKR